MPEPRTSSFGLDDFGVDDRLRLFSYVNADNRLAYLWLLRAFDAARSSYHVVLHTSDVQAALAGLAGIHHDCPDPAGLDLPRLLDALVDWGVLDRGQDGTRAATLAEYRNRHSVYQFTEAGYRAHRAVESVLAAGLDDSTLSRLVFADLLADLKALATATHDVRPEVFLSHKDALLAHLRDFHDELQRYTPRLREAVHEVEATGLERMVEAAAEADERLFATPVERIEDWRRRWRGLRSWLAPETDRPSEADRLSGATMAAIGDVLALLRRVTEARRGGVSRESQLRHLAAWFTGAGSDEAAHAVFDVVFGLGAPRHVGVAYPDPDAIPGRLSWWEAPAVELSRTLVQSGRMPGQGNGRIARIERSESSRRALRERQVAEERRQAEAATSLIDAETLTDAQAGALRRLLDIALATRQAGRRESPLAAAAFGVRLTLTPCPGRFTTVPTESGRLHIDGFELSVTTAAHTVARRAEPMAA